MINLNTCDLFQHLEPRPPTCFPNTVGTRQGTNTSSKDKKIVKKLKKTANIKNKFLNLNLQH